MNTMTLTAAQAADQVRHALDEPAAGLPCPMEALARDLADGFRSRAAALDAQAGFPETNINELRESGLLTMVLPASHGGLGADMGDAARVLHALSMGCASTALIFNMHIALSGQLAHMNRREPEGQWSRWLSAAAKGQLLLGGALSESRSWNAAMFPQTVAMRVQGGWRVTGDRSFCTGSSRLDLMQCTARVGEGDQARCLYFLMDPGAAGITYKNDWDTMGMRGSHSQGFKMQDVFIPEDHVLYEYPYGVLDFSEIWMSFLAWSFIGFASVYSGIAQEARNIAVATISGRLRAPGPDPLTHKSTNQLRAADMDLANHVMRAVREDAARRHPNSAPATIETVLDTAMAKQTCVTKAIEVVDHAVAMVGGQAYFRKLSLERLKRDVAAGPFHPFSVDDSREMVGKLAFGLPFLEQGGWAI